MDNATRRGLLTRHRQSQFPGSILDVFKAHDQGIDLIGEFEQQQMQVAQTPQQQQQGLRPAHQAGNVNQSMAFPNVPPNTPFNTMGMKAPIDIKKFNEQGHLVKSYDNVPPGVQSLPTGPQRGTVIETPANMQSGGVIPGMQQYAQYNNLNPELAAAVASRPQNNDRLTSSTDAQMRQFNNRGEQTRVNKAQTNVSNRLSAAGSNAYQFHKDKPLDALGMDLAIAGQLPVIGEVADLANAGISGVRGLYNTAVGDTAKAKEQFTLAGLSAASAVPFAGNAVGAARIAKAGHNISHKAHTLEKGVIGAKAFKASAYERKQAGGFKGTPPSFGIDSELLKAGVAGTESSAGVNMMNPGSTATGLYGQLFSEVKNSYPGTRKEFSTNIAAQDSIFDKRLYEGLNNEKSMMNNLEHMYKNYPDQIAKKGYSAEQLAGIINMLGRQGTREYLGYVVRDKKDLADVFPSKYGPNVPKEKKNKTPDEYAKTMQSWINKYAKDNCPGGDCEETTQTQKYFKLRK